MIANRTGPNAPCPCGSGKKYKRCCQEKATAASSNGNIPTGDLTSEKYRFEPGSYGGKSMFAASISCLKQVRPGEWAYHFVLACPDALFKEEQAAVAAATQHLDAAFAEKRRTGADAVLAACLKQQGYILVALAPR